MRRREGVTAAGWAIGHQALLRLRVDIDRRPSLIRRMTKWFQRTVSALRTSRYTEFSPMPDHFMRKVRPAFLRNNPHQVVFNLSRVLVLGEFQPS
jgi:hypothetical protein